MAYKYSRKNLPTISSTAGDAYTADPIGDLNKANEIAEKELRKTDISQRAEMLKSISGYGDTSYDQQFNDKTDALLLHYADEYAKVTDGLNRGTIDVAEGTAYKQQLMDKLDVYQKFVIASKTVEDVMAKAEGIQKGGVGSLIVGGGINDLEAAEMIHNLWNNPESLEIGGDNDGRGMYLKNTKTGKVINMTEFNQMVGDGKSFLEEIPDFKTNTKTAMDAILANPNIGEFKYDQTYTDANGNQSKRDMYNVAILRDEFAKADPWSAILTSSTESNAAWEWLNGTNQKFEGLEGEWYGNEMKTDGSGEYTDRATKQRAALKDALTQYTINTNIPKHQNDEFNVLKSRSLKEKTTDKSTGTGDDLDFDGVNYNELIDINNKVVNLVEPTPPGIPITPQEMVDSYALNKKYKADKEKYEAVVEKAPKQTEAWLKKNLNLKELDGVPMSGFIVEYVDDENPNKGMRFVPEFDEDVEVPLGKNPNTGKFTLEPGDEGYEDSEKSDKVTNVVSKKARAEFNEGFVIGNDLKTFVNYLKKETAKVTGSDDPEELFK
jgi:hypothetical protein